MKKRKNIITVAIDSPAAAGESMATVIIFFLFFNLFLHPNILIYLKILEKMY